MLRRSGLGQRQEGRGHIGLHDAAGEHGEEGRAIESDGASSADCSDTANEIAHLLQEKGRQRAGSGQ